MSAEAQRRWRDRHPDVAKAVAKRYDQSEKGRERHRKGTVTYRAAHPDRWKAHKAIEVEIRLGHLTPDPCARCGGQPTRAHHHNGYAAEDRLVVTWLCDLHHREAHR